jgi:hydrogenase maturation protein HypF
VILDRRRRDDLPPDISPGIDTLGVMLPYTPLHHLLFADDLEILVMTSANISDDPLIIDNDEALVKLREIADYFLMHNREIFNRCDDSVTTVVDGKPQIIRRARGYVPLPVELPCEVPPILACGGELKNTFCMTKGNGAYPSQHLGDLNHFGNYRQFLDTIPRFETMLNVKPEIVAHDLHPEYMATKWAKSLENVKLVGVQHHHAHMASCMAENGLTEKVLGVICDGTGYGTDGNIWGFEFLVGDYLGFDRAAHLSYQPLPGGDVTVRYPERMALTYLYRLFGAEGLAAAEEFLGLSDTETQVVLRQIQNRLNTIPTSSCGRLFDAVSALLGVCRAVQYEGQAAIELETILDPAETGSYPFALDTAAGPYTIETAPMWRELLQDLRGGVSKEIISARFHRTVVAMIVRTAETIREETGVNQVVLSGGVFQNRFLFEHTREQLTKAGFEVFHHAEVPSNDGGISVGQAIIAYEVIKNVSGDSGKNHGN